MAILGPAGPAVDCATRHEGNPRRQSILVKDRIVVNYRFLAFVLLLYCLLAPLNDSWSAERDSLSWRQTVISHLDREGYLGTFRNGQGLQRAIAAYLWDHRNELRVEQISRAGQHDAAICLLMKKGYPGFDAFAKEDGFHRRCEKMTK